MKKILLIEDNDELRNNTAEILELSNYKVIRAENGKTGIAKAIEHLPDLIICDIMMPQLDGYGVLHAIHNNDSIKNTPFIFITANADRSEYRKGMELGADDYITKPFDGTELLRAIDSRIKKNDLLHQDFFQERGKSNHLIQTATGIQMLESLVQDRNINKYKKKQVIYSAGNHANKLYFIVKGKIKIFKQNEDGKELVTGIFSEGDFFGYIALLENYIYNDSAVAIEETQLAIIPKDEFEELIQNNKAVAYNFIHLLATDVVAKEEKLLGIAYNSLRKKVATALILLEKKYKQKKEGSIVIDISRDNLASIAGTAKESLIRTLGEFKSEKLIDVSKEGSITILNPHKLEQLPF